MQKKKKRGGEKKGKKEKKRVERMDGHLHLVAWSYGYMWCPEGRLGWRGRQGPGT